MDLVVKNKIIQGKLETILLRLKRESHKPNLFRDMSDSKTDIVTTCPYHKGGNERTPSCTFYRLHDNSNIQFGHMHCFSCGKTASLPEVVAHCLGCEEEEGKDWLYQRFGGDSTFEDIDSPIQLQSTRSSDDSFQLDREVLRQFNYYHPYMEQRKLTREVIDRFQIGYDPVRDAITFPVYDSKDRLKFITARSVNTKKFWIPPGVDKPVYLLNFVLKENITQVYVAESQINTLTLWSWNKPAIGLFGTGSDLQYDILRHSGIRRYILALDPDAAGYHGTKKFIQKMSDNAIIDVVDLPPNGKDVNDYSLREFEAFNVLNSFDWLEKHKQNS